ncbi:RNA polymerase sigma-70 factor, ECF subfamily [Hymenobacter arizonensis]|uniref:RNA polymerase sigma-70 factor, ECF subfamily n=2 Tax=Hymenobacter arizonensis TaxID=1227077 RepID=A0A1I5YSM0_HYMAR|nr:RNA polymerase sigma-70 factor, ECF subfamily [Hymenobacter arizonensis]
MPGFGLAINCPKSQPRMSAAPSAEFVAALNEYQPLLRRVARLYCQDSDDRQDLFQEMVLQLWRAWPRYVPQPGAKLSTWLYRIALNVAISNLRQRTRRPVSGELCAEALAVAQAPEAGPDAEDRAALYQAIDQLSEVDKAFVLLYLEDRPYEEMAEILGITQNNVRVKMHRVQEKLRQLLPVTTR